MNTYTAIYRNEKTGAVTNLMGFAADDYEGAITLAAAHANSDDSMTVRNDETKEEYGLDSQQIANWKVRSPEIEAMRETAEEFFDYLDECSKGAGLKMTF